MWVEIQEKKREPKPAVTGVWREWGHLLASDSGG